MTKLDDAKKLWQRKQSQYRKTTKLRTAYTGDGRGTAESNFYYQYGGNNQYIWVRTPDSLDKPFPVLNRGAVRPGFNIPVWLGTTEIEPKREQVLGVNYDAYGAIADGTDGIGGIGPHHDQHEWDGGDEVFIDPRQFNYALVYPTNPVSMQVGIKAFTYFYGDWQRYAGETSVSFSSYIPSVGYRRYILVSYNPIDSEIDYKIGDEFLSALPVPLTGNTLANIPDPSHAHLPLGIILLSSLTTSINWDTELFDGRKHILHGDNATAVGQVRVSTDGSYYESLMPVTDEVTGMQLMDEKTGYLLYS